MVLGATDHRKGIYIWWCLFVNNQFRLLEDGQTQNTSDFIHVFGQQVEGIGKMLMCLDQMRGSLSKDCTCYLALVGCSGQFV